MDLCSLIDDKSIRALDKREMISTALASKAISMRDIKQLQHLDDKKWAIILEAMEAVTRSNPEAADLEWLLLAEEYILAKSNSLKREASRVIGNMAEYFPDQLARSVPKLMQNSHDEGTVVRWSSAYALARILALPQYAQSELFDEITALFENELENGVKNQYLVGLKKARKIR